MGRPEDTPPLGESIGEIIDRTTKIVHEEIELAKAEISVALQDLLRGSVAGIVGGVFAFFGLFILLIAFSFLVADAVGAWYPWLGFFIVAFLCFIVGGLLAFVALKKIKKGSQIAPTQAIDEAKQTKEALTAEPADEKQTIDSVAVEEPEIPAATPAPTIAPATPAAAAQQTKEQEAVAEAETQAEEAKAEVEEAREEAESLEVDAKEAKRRAKQEAKEAKEAEKAAKKAEAEAAKAEAIAKKKAEKAAKEAEKARVKAEKQAAKDAKKAEKAGGPAALPERDVLGQPQPTAEQPTEPYSPPQPPQTPPPPPNDPTGSN